MNIRDKLGGVFKNFFPNNAPPTPNEPVVSYEKDIQEAKSILLKAANREIDVSQSDIVVNSLQDLEKLMRKQNKADNGKTAETTFENLNGCWQLIFTTGTVKTQEKIGGRVNYFPVKAVQTFDTTTMKITNGIYIKDYAFLQFFGLFEYNKNLRKVIFDFNQIALFGLKFNLPTGGAGEIGAKTGLGTNAQTDKEGSFFNWISADSEIATARG